MNNINFGIAKSVVANITTQSMLDNKLNESSGVAKNFLRIIENSEVLQNEFEVYSNIEGKNIESEVLAARYVENNISLMNRFTSNEISEAHNTLIKFVEDNMLFEYVNVSNEKITLYKSINNLIVNDDTKINENHQATENILNYLKYSEDNQTSTNETEESFVLLEGEIDLEQIVESALKKFNSKFNTFNEDERKVVTLTINEDNEGKVNLLDSLKFEVSEMVKLSKKAGIEDKINETIEKINSMEFENKSFVKNVSKLINLKKSLS